ncbi:MAG: hypothetical protein PHX56_01325 [Atribacterota bacterium]|nr:hypothetical protein [Atribacterota bacterium]
MLPFDLFLLCQKEIAKGLNIINGKITYKPVSDAFDLKYYPIDELYG